MFAQLPVMTMMKIEWGRRGETQFSFCMRSNDWCIVGGISETVKNWSIHSNDRSCVRILNPVNFNVHKVFIKFKSYFNQKEKKNDSLVEFEDTSEYNLSSSMAENNPAHFNIHYVYQNLLCKYKCFFFSLKNYLKEFGETLELNLSSSLIRLL